MKYKVIVYCSPLIPNKKNKVVVPCIYDSDSSLLYVQERSRNSHTRKYVYRHFLIRQSHTTHVFHITSTNCGDDIPIYAIEDLIKQLSKYKVLFTKYVKEENIY